MIVTPVTVKGKETENKESTNLDNKLKRSPKETLFLLMFFLRDDQKALLQFILKRLKCGRAKEECKER